MGDKMIRSDSRKIQEGDIFIALKGPERDGHEYIEEAIQKGASLIIAEKGEYDIPTFIVPNTNEYLREHLSIYEYPKIKHIKLIGITGTNGKTTSSYLFYESLLQLNKKCAYIGTIGFYKEKKIRDLNNTTPGLLELYELLEECVDCEYVVMEVSSHALDMGRCDTLLFDYAIFTNLTNEHLNYHKTMKNYALAKQKLFKMLKRGGKAIVNIDDDYKETFLLQENNNITYGEMESDYQLLDYQYTVPMKFRYLHKNEIKEVTTELFGKYNIYNLMTTIILLEEEKLDGLSVIPLLQAPKGRMEKIKYKDSFIIVDYAHSPDAVAKILEAVKEMPHHHIYTILGCGGNRDHEKRPVMGKVATEHSDYVFFTSDNPRDENPMDILKEMTDSLNSYHYEILVDREKAIQKGMQKLQKNDILVVLGKGHENYQIIKGEKIHFDDVEMIQKYM